MRKFNKKGVDQRLFMSLLVLALVFVLLFFVVNGVGKYIQTKTNVEACRASVLGATQLGEGNLLGSISPGEWEFECPPNEVRITDEEYEVNGGKKAFYHEEWEENVKSVIANEMYECWYKFGEGDLDAFDQSVFPGIDNICFYCSYIQFENPESSTVEGVEEYLKDYMVLGALAKGEETTYWDYIYQTYRSNGETIGNIFFAHDKDTIYTDWEYVIVFHAISIGSEATQTISGDDNTYVLHVGPAENTGANCDYYYE